MSRSRSSQHGFPVHGWLGVLLVALFWPLNWLIDGLRTHWCFFPLWLGYCLMVDGVNLRRTGTSLLSRSRATYIGLFVISVPAWWIFEIINWRTNNWIYLGRELFGDLEYVALATLSFSTVVPAVLGTAELMAPSRLVQRFRHGPVLSPGPRGSALLFLTGLAMLALLLVWPRFFFPLVWLALVFVLEPVNRRLGNRSLLEWTAKGDWRPPAALGSGVLVCGFLWEMWNFLSFPKWTYRIPWFGFWRVFEMPLLGYLGYVPFSLELFAMVHLVLGLAGRRGTDYVVAGWVVRREERSGACRISEP